MSGYILIPTAQEDLVAIRDYYLEAAGSRIARQMLGEFVKAFRFFGRHFMSGDKRTPPEAGHKREDLAEGRPVLFWPMRDFLIVYRQGSSPLQIVTVARGTRDGAALFVRRDL